MTLLSLQDVSHAVRLSESSIRRAVKAGELVGLKVRGRYRISAEALDAWLAGNSNPTVAPPAKEAGDAPRH